MMLASMDEPAAHLARARANERSEISHRPDSEQQQQLLQSNQGPFRTNKNQQTNMNAN
jgi:hypothetical protein